MSNPDFLKNPEQIQISQYDQNRLRDLEIDTINAIQEDGSHSRRPIWNRGLIVQVVKPGDRPDQKRFPRLVIGAGTSRRYLSYVVEVKKPSGNADHYWPLTKNLKRVS